jgi:thioredoxin-like negative regulator of GroEL
MIQKVGIHNFKEFLGQKRYAVLLFYATWNAPSNILRMRLEAVAPIYRDQVVCGVANVEEIDESVGGFVLNRFPTLAFYRDQQLVALLHQGHCTVSDQIEQLLSGEEIREGAG